MPVSTQDLKKGIDITGLVVVTGSEINQEVDVARIYDDKGMLIITTDTLAGIPDVPNPDVADGMGIVPIWWKRYVWIRRPIPADNINPIRAYVWNPNIAPVATYLNWVSLTTLGDQAYQLAVLAGTDATNAQTAANAAQVAANNAQVTAALSGQTANTALIEAQNTQLDLNQFKGSVQPFLTGGFMLYGGSTKAFSNDVDGGWLECLGQAVSRVTFANLFNVIGTNYGGGDGSTTFNIPNLQSRIPIGAGIGPGLSLREVGKTYGEETVTLTGDQTGIKAHNHTLQYDKFQADGNARNAAGSLLGAPLNPAVGTGALTTDTNLGLNAITPHDNMPPVLGVRFIIKT